MQEHEYATLAYEEPLLKTPLTALLRQVRQDGKRLEKEWGVVKRAISTLEQRGGGTPEQLAAALGKISAKLRGVKRKFAESSAGCIRDADLCVLRARYVANAPERPSSLRANPAFALARCDRHVADCLMRWGMTGAAAEVARSAGIQDLCDCSEFECADKALAGLRRRSCAEALEWCADNRSRLRRVGSDLELQLRLQECSTMPAKDAVSHAKRHAAPLAVTPEQQEQLCKAVGSAVLQGVRPARYDELRSDRAWKQLCDRFSNDFAAVLGCGEYPLLLPLLQSGLLALNAGVAEDGPQTDSADPLHSSALRDLSAGLPVMSVKNSTLVCAVTGDVMSDSNPPLVTPGGYVYSTKAVQRLAEEPGDGHIWCPRTGERFPVADLRKAFIM